MSGPREKAPEAAPQSGGRCAGGVGRGPAILSLLFSLLSVGACFLLSAKTSKLQGRLVALEEELASRAWSPGEQLAAEPFLAALQPQVDDLLQESRARPGNAGRALSHLTLDPRLSGHLKALRPGLSIC